MTSSLIQPFIDKENASHAPGVFSKGKHGSSVGFEGSRIGKTFQSENSGIHLKTPRRALGDVNRDVSQPIQQQQSTAKKLPGKICGPANFSLLREANKNAVHPLKAPAPAKPLSSRQTHKQPDQNTKKVKKSQIQLHSAPLCNQKARPGVMPFMHDDIEHMNIYHDTEEEYEELVFPKRERPSTFLYGLGGWNPSIFTESDSDEDCDTLDGNLTMLADLPEDLKRPPQFDNSLEENLFELSEEFPDDIPLTSLDLF